MNENFEMLKAKGLCEIGEHVFCKGYVGKSMEGDESKVYTCPSFTEPDRQPEPAESIRLGDLRLLSQVRFMPEDSRSYRTTGDAQVLAADPFLRGQAVGTPSGGPAGGARKPIQGYVYDEPDADKRESMNWLASGESGIAPAALPNFPDAGEVGARVIKRAAGIFTDLIRGRAKR